MQCFVNGQEVPGMFLGRREMNFSQPAPEVARMVAFRISLKADEFAEKMAAVFSRAAQEDKADAPFHHTGEWPIVDRWSELGYPSPKELLQREPTVLEGLVRNYFDMETLDQFVPGPASGLPRYLLNSIDKVDIQNGWIHLEGNAFIHPQWTEDSSESIPSQSNKS